MIKPHGSDELNPLFVYDTEKHETLSREAETGPATSPVPASLAHQSCNQNVPEPARGQGHSVKLLLFRARDPARRNASKFAHALDPAAILLLESPHRPNGLDGRCER